MKRRREDEDDEIDHKPSKAISSKAGDFSYRRKLYAVSVRDTLRKKSEGDATEYQNLVRRFTTATALKEVASMEELHLLLNALSHLVSHLDRKHSVLVNAILSLQWASAEESFAKSYISFVGLLLSAQSQYGVDVLEKAVEGLSFQPDVSALNLDSSNADTTKRLTRRDLYERHHDLLQHVLSIVPTLTKALHPIITRRYPHKRLDKIYHVTYVRNILRMVEYCPGLSDHVMGLVIERIIQIDVEIQVELDELEEIGQSSEAVFDLDDDPFDAEISSHTKVISAPDDDTLEEEDGFSDISSESELDLDEDDNKVKIEESTDPAHVRESVSKLDGVLKLLFDHLVASHSPRAPPKSLEIKPSPPSSPTSPYPKLSPPTLPPMPFSEVELYDIQSAQFQALLHTFERTVLRTFKSRYTQFLLFWFTSLHPDFTDAFLGILVSKATNSSSPSNRETPLTRAAAASYLASFVSRARFVDGASVRSVVRLLCTYLAKELEAYYEEVKVPVHISLYAPFYAVAQAVFLIFCFRWRDLRFGGEGEGLKNEDGEGDRKKEGNGDGYVEDDEDDALGLNDDSKREERIRWIPELDIVQQVIVSPLNPLKFCSETVVEQFASVASKTTFAFCYSIIEQNKRSTFYNITPTIILPPSSIASSSRKPSLGALAPSNNKPTTTKPHSHSYAIISGPSRMTGTPAAGLLIKGPQPTSMSLPIPKSIFSTSTGNGNAKSSHNHNYNQEAANHLTELNAFFPFDPFQLPLSRRYIDGVYREWSEVRIDDGGEGDGEETDEEEGDSTSEGENVRFSDSDNDGHEEEEEEEDVEGEEGVDGKGKKSSPLGVPVVAHARARARALLDDDDDVLGLGLGESFGGMSISPARMEVEGSNGNQNGNSKVLAVGV